MLSEEGRERKRELEREKKRVGEREKESWREKKRVGETSGRKEIDGN